MRRRHVIQGLLAVPSVALPGLGLAQSASDTRRLVIPYPPGGFTDIVSRMVAEKLQAATGQTFVADNRPGAGTNIAAEAVAKAAPDGKTLLMGTSSLAINPSLYAKLAYNAQTDLRPLGVFAATGYALLASPTVKANNVQELIQLLKANPGKFTYGSSGNGAVNHLAGEMFKSMTGTYILHVPYRGSGPAITDLIGGSIDLYWASILEALPLVSAGRVKLIGTTNAEKIEALPAGVPMAQTIKDYRVEFWMGLFAPAATPTADTAKIEEALRGIALDPGLGQELNKRGAQARYADAKAAQQLLASETQRWAAVIKRSGAKVD